MLRVRSAGLSLTLNIPQCTKKKEKASVKVSKSLLVKTRFTWEPQSFTVQSDSLAGLTNHGFNVLSSNVVNKKSFKKNHEQQLNRDPIPPSLAVQTKIS